MTAVLDARRSMVEQQIRARGIADQRVLDAMRALPRERFVPSRIADLAYERGLAGTRTAISNTAEFGAFVAGDRLVDDTTRTKLDALLAEVRDGSFARRFRDDAQAGFPWMSRRRAAAAQERIERAGASVRRWMPWLGGREDTR